MMGASLSIFSSQLIGFSVFANGPVDISIVELVDDGSGNLTPWVDIDGVMPGLTYSAIPRVRNDGLVPVEARMCISESAISKAGDVIVLPPNAFEIDINKNWALDVGGIGNASDPASGNCYKHYAIIEPGAISEPLFSEVKVGAAIENSHKGATFNLHLEAEAMWESPDRESFEPINSTTPASPDTEFNTVLYFDIVKPVFFAAGGVGFFATVAYLFRFFRRRQK